MERVKTNLFYYRLVSQQIGSADSICANIEEGYGRLSRVEYVRFLDIARGSARETRGRYERMKHWLGEDDSTTNQTSGRDHWNFNGFDCNDEKKLTSDECRVKSKGHGAERREGKLLFSSPRHSNPDTLLPLDT
jgi:23S rRNA-intervening sequence protein